MSNCTNPKINELIEAYQADLLTETERQQVDAHLLECDECFQKVYEMNEVFDLLEQIPEAFSKALAPKPPPWFVRIRNFIANLIEDIGNLFKLPTVKILVPVAIAAALLLIILKPATEIDYSDLAIFEKAPYFQVREAVENTETQRIFAEGMNLYQNAKYNEAIPYLEKYSKMDSTDAFGHFYLGVASGLTGQYEESLIELNKATHLAQEHEQLILRRRCQWYLGNACLKLNQVDPAVTAFEALAAYEDIYYKEAQLKLKQIRERQLGN